MRSLLLLCLAGLGASAIFIGGMIFILGAQFTAGFFAVIPTWFGATGELSRFDTADIDGELRFYSVFWIAYGVALIAVATSLEDKMHWIPWLAGLFFFGGIGRVLSILQFGMPHALFQVLLGIELILPVIVAGLWLSLRRSA